MIRITQIGIDSDPNFPQRSFLTVAIPQNCLVESGGCFNMLHAAYSREHNRFLRQRFSQRTVHATAVFPCLC